MRIAELINDQTEWERRRGIKNGNWGADRIQLELNEAREEPDLNKKLIEFADVIIITTGSVGALLKALDMTAEDFERVLADKLLRNDVKYPEPYFKGRTTEEAIQFCRDNWYP